MNFPYFASGTVVKGFGRGSRQLGIPTANFPDDVVDLLPAEYEEGVYYGWAQVDNGEVYKMVMSIGKNPHFNNTKRTMETYIIHEFNEDFYGSLLKISVLGYIRAMTSYPSLEELIAAIHSDIRIANEELDMEENNNFQSVQQFNNQETRSETQTEINVPTEASSIFETTTEESEGTVSLEPVTQESTTNEDIA